MNKEPLFTILFMMWDNPSEACPAFRGMRGMIALWPVCRHPHMGAYCRYIIGSAECEGAEGSSNWMETFFVPCALCRFQSRYCGSLMWTITKKRRINRCHTGSTEIWELNEHKCTSVKNMSFCCSGQLITWRIDTNGEDVR